MQIPQMLCTVPARYCSRHVGEGATVSVIWSLLYREESGNIFPSNADNFIPLLDCQSLEDSECNSSVCSTGMPVANSSVCTFFMCRQDQFDTVDFSDNDIRKLDGFPLLKRLKTMLLNNNRIV